MIYGWLILKISITEDIHISTQFLNNERAYIWILLKSEQLEDWIQVSNNE